MQFIGLTRTLALGFSLGLAACGRGRELGCDEARVVARIEKARAGDAPVLYDLAIIAKDGRRLVDCRNRFTVLIDALRPELEADAHHPRLPAGCDGVRDRAPGNSGRDARPHARDRRGPGV